MSEILIADVDSPFGPLLAAEAGGRLVRLAFGDERAAAIEELSARGDVVEDARALAPVRHELGEYFDGRRRRFGIQVDLSSVRGFERRVLEATRRIPFGSVATYGEVAADAGSPRAARAAGNALNGNPVPIVVPCHRVVPASGGLGGYGGHEERKERLLRLEGSL